MRLSVVFSLCLILAYAAPSSFAAAAEPAEKPAGKPAAPTVQKPRPFTWPVIKSWYDEGEDARAVRASKLLGRPIAIVCYVEGKSRGSVKRLKSTAVTKYFVCLVVTEKSVKRNGKKKASATSKFLKQVLAASGHGPYPTKPIMIVATWDGEFLGAIADIRDRGRADRAKKAKELIQAAKKAKTDAEAEIKKITDYKDDKGRPYVDRMKRIANERSKIGRARVAAQKELRKLRLVWPHAINSAARQVAQKHGKLLKESRARAGWKGLMTARRLWHAGDNDGAMKHYRIARSAARVNTRMELAVELGKDIAAIEYRGAEQVDLVEDEYRRGDLDKAEAEARKMRNTYKGFEAAKHAKALFDRIRAARAERTVVANEAKKEPVDNPPRKPRVKPDKNDEKNGGDDDDDKGDDDDDYEDDF